MKHLRTVLSYLLIIAAGLAIGTLAPRVSGWIKGDHTKGDYSAYFPDSSTKVVFYGTETCPYCAKARDYLRGRGVAFADYDVNRSPQAKQAFGKLEGVGVPLVIIGNRRIDGYNVKAFDAALKEAGLPAAALAQAR